jgi:Yip1 domain
MRLDRASLSALAVESVRAPRVAARRLLGLRTGAALALPALAATASLSALFSSVMLFILPVVAEPGMLDGILSRPLLLAGMQALGLALLALLVTAVGRVFGGRGRLMDAILLLSWVDFLFLMAEAALTLLTLAIPGLGVLMTLVVAGASVWLTASFIAELHGFSSTLGVAAALIGAFVLFFVALMQIAPPM